MSRPRKPRLTAKMVHEIFSLVSDRLDDLEEQLNSEEELHAESVKPGGYQHERYLLAQKLEAFCLDWKQAAKRG